MPDDLLKLLAEHPACQLAQEALQKLGASPDERMSPLLQLAQESLARRPPQRGWAENPYLVELEEETIPELAKLPLNKQARLLVADWETMQHELAYSPEEWPVLKRHLDGLNESLQEADEKERAPLLVGNLFQNLRHSSPSFGPLSG